MVGKNWQLLNWKKMQLKKEFVYIDVGFLCFYSSKLFWFPIVKVPIQRDVILKTDFVIYELQTQINRGIEAHAWLILDLC